MKVLNALQIKAGATSEIDRMGNPTQPVQFLLSKDKDEKWGAWNMDWFESQGLIQLRKNSRRFLKNYKLANGIIDKTDYIVEEDNEQAELIDILTKEDESAFELKFYPIVPNVINVMTGEFAKRNDKITYRAVDDISYNEMAEDKRNMIEQSLVYKGEQKMKALIDSMGIDQESEEGQQKVQEMMSPENIKSLPEIEQFFKKSYRSMLEQWAQHQHVVDEERFSMRELETTAFRDMLTVDREFWHFKMNEDDYEVELWNPALTFYHKSPNAKYVSQSNFVGKVDLMTIPDIIDNYGYMMNKDQLSSLESIYPAMSSAYILPGLQNDGSFYDSTRSHDWNTTGPSLGMRQFLSFRDNFESNGDDILYKILGESEDTSMFGNTGLLRVTTCYWKSQRMIGHLTKITDEGMMIEMIVDENYLVTEKPIYDLSVMKNKTRETLVFGEHIEWIWINQTWGGIKIGHNRPSFYPTTEEGDMEPIYLNVKPIKFQFKGDFTLYGCKLPVEGCIFSDRNTRSSSLVDKMKPFQIGYNTVNNQISDIIVDELGTVIMLDQNALPRHSMGEDWGKNNFAKAYVAMKDFQMLPLDTSITNTENGLNFNHYQVLNLEQTNRLLSRINLANYFKDQAFQAIGISPQRLGSISAEETKGGIEQAVNNSYSQTEMYFIQHSEYLMPRVHQMRTDLAQYYHSNKPSVRLSYMTAADEKINFEINGTQLLGRDLNIFLSTKVNHRQIQEQIRSLALSNNAAGTSLYDLGKLVKAQSLAEIDHTLKSMEEKANQAKERELQAMQETEKLKQEGENKRMEAEQAFKAEQNQLDRESNEREAEIRAAGFTGMKDLNNDGESDYISTLEYLDKKNASAEAHSLNQEKELNKKADSQIKNNLKREEILSKERIADKQVQIALANKNKYDKKKS